ASSCQSATSSFSQAYSASDSSACSETISDMDGMGRTLVRAKDSLRHASRDPRFARGLCSSVPSEVDAPGRLPLDQPQHTVRTRLATTTRPASQSSRRSVEYSRSIDRARGDPERSALAADSDQDRRRADPAGRDRRAVAGVDVRLRRAAALGLPLLLLVPAGLGLHRRRAVRGGLPAAEAGATPLRARAPED